MIKTFKQFIAEGAGHLTHVEDLVLYGGVDGTRNAINTLRSVRDMLAGHSPKHIHATTKYDGAPAIFCGIDPADKKFFVAKKSIFNKEPLVYKTHDDIDSDTEGDLATKLHIALDELSRLGIKGIIQGDIMFTHDTLKQEEIDGHSYITFHPNTIVYAIPAETQLANQIKNAKIGVVFHTSYKGKLGNLQAEPGVNTTGMKKIPSVWWQTAAVQDLSGTATMTAEETAQVTAALSSAGKAFQRISATVLKEIGANEDFARELEAFNNTKVRKGEVIGNPAQHAKELIAWFEDRLNNDIASKKSPKGKSAAEAKKEEKMRFFSPSNQANLELIYTLQNNLVQAKNLLIHKLNDLGGMKTFLKTASGYEVTGQEGYVIADHLSGNTVKLVDRLSFSHANFSPEILKGWQR
jgi:hypothetical protein